MPRTISRAVIQKFNEAKGWDCQTINDLVNCIYSPLTRHRHAELVSASPSNNVIAEQVRNDDPIAEANTIFNTIRICDPAVGSGHFLVSALNEMIYLKSELGILLYKNSERRLKDYRVAVENDELLITDNEGNYFHYNPKDIESQKVQETFFHEKQTIIENCLFGVDINPNSVKICQLRLWIELLKHAYYIMENGELKMENGNRKLQTLPNIDINIKCGNSLVSRFSLKDQYHDVQGMMQKIKNAARNYKEQVFLYKLCQGRGKKRHIVKNIEHEKSIIYEILNAKDSDFRKWQDARDKTARHLYADLNFGDDKEQWKKINEELTAEETALRDKYEQKIKGLYKDAFEWRFEFPEVLDDDGNFVGFDVVMGNPPYINVNNDKIYSKYKTYKCLELYAYFFEKSFDLLKEKGIISLITGSLYLKGVKYQSLRDFLTSNYALIKLDNVGDSVFDNVKMPTSVLIGKKDINQFWNFEEMNKDFSLLKKIEENTISLSQISKIMRGLEFGRDRIQTNADIPFITGSNVCKYGVTKLSYIDIDTLNEYSKDKYFFEGERLLLRETGSDITTLYLNELLYSNRSLYSIKIIDESLDPKFVLGCLNSKLLQFYYQTKFKAETDFFPKIRIIQAKELPIIKISLPNQQPIITLVNQILAAKKENPAADTAALEREIDLLVYGLYGLTEEEVKVIEK